MLKRYSQLELFESPKTPSVSENSQANSVRVEDMPIHNWYRFVLSFPPHLVRDYLSKFGASANAVVVDPFCGTGTTVVESKLSGLRAIGIEANPFPHFAAAVKTDWSLDPDYLEGIAEDVAARTYMQFSHEGIDDLSLTADRNTRLRCLPPSANKALIQNSISALPLHKSLVLLDHIREHEEEPAYKYCLLALGNALVSSIGNLRFGPEVGVGRIKPDAHVVAPWLANVRRMARDIRPVNHTSYPIAQVLLADARSVASVLPKESVDIVITSPPYPNEKDYTRTTRLESVVLGFYSDMRHLRELKKGLLRSNTRGVYRNDEDEQWIADHVEIQRIADEIDKRRLELGKTSGFERLYSRVTRLYFGGMARHLSEMRTVLRPGAKLAYVVGDQASYLRVMIRTGQLLADIADRLGYTVDGIDLFRTRFSTATQTELREEVIILTWPGW